MDWASVLRIVLVGLVAVVGALEHRTKKHVDRVHVLVNSNLSDIKKQLAEMTAKRDVLQMQKDDDARGDRGRHESDG